jgi:mannitol-specific phosphotransferase system IIBC component
MHPEKSNYLSKRGCIFRGGKENQGMKGKILSILTAILFGASIMAAPVVVSAQTTEKAGVEQTQPKKVKKAKKAKKSKKKASKKAKKSKKKAAKKNQA